MFATTRLFWILLLACLSLASGLILSTVTRARNELKRLHYLSYSIRFLTK